ncbi:Methionine gamma-lyase isoform A [Micractinium conductrix]|uniref:Methionine gamma-lyase isoform A n=1 Tax=Micractinium conductrix TaxID=554055 RepID=A0A2P6V8P4_9CHLO|nr:Methionine gamma-lyase isoform A [Micractinium conductrix]|eukprot:PSC70464.1 Methionine gamma-lyase isoform A [Micractinium conductrix]
MFEATLHELLCNSLGSVLNISREQLRISLWSAWRTGLTLENVGLRPDAFEHLQLPFTLRSGNIGRIQAQVPWRALRSPVVVELSDVHLRIALRRDEELSEGAAAERAWLTKQAELAAAELAALAAAQGGGGGSDAGGTRAGGVLWSFVQHVLSMLLNRLQLSVSKVHIEFEDAESGTVLGVQLSRLHTCRPSDAEHASLLLSDDAGLRVHGSAAARGSIQKQFAVEGLAVYCQPRATAAPAGGAAAPQQRPDKQQQPRQLSYVLLPTDLVLHSTLQLSAGVGGGGDGGAAGTAGGMRVHAAAVVSHLELSLDGGQAADMLALSDRVAWCAARNRFAPYCPDGWRSPGPRAVPWRHVWRYAVNAVLHDLRGERQGCVPWADGAARVALRRQYIEAYRAHLERKHLLEGAAASSSAAARRRALAEADEALPALERGLSVDDILTCRHTAQRVLEASLAAASGMGEAIEDGAAAAGSVRRRAPPPLPASVVGGVTPSVAAGAGAGTLVAGLAVAPPSCPASLGGSSSAASSSLPGGPAATAGSGGRRGYLAWGLSKAASFLRYLPYSAAGEAGAGALPEPTEAELEELYEAVDFHPEEQQAAAAAASRAGGAATGLHLSLDVLVSKASLLLLDAPPAAAAMAATVPSQQLQQQQSGGGGGGDGGAIATLELDRVKVAVQVAPSQTSAVLTVADVAAHDLCSEGQGVSSELLLRGTPGTPAAMTAAAGAATAVGHGADDGYVPPLLKVHFTAAAPPAGESAGEARPQLDVLVQPLLLRPRPPCVQRLLALVPAAVADSLHGRRQAAVNGLSAEACCAIKARQVAALGPPLSLLLKVVDVEVHLGAGDCRTAPGVHLRTGPIMLVSADGEEGRASPAAAAAAAGKGPGRSHGGRQRATHALTAAEAAAHLSAVIKQRRIAARLGVRTPAGSSGRLAGEASAGGQPSGSLLDAAAAVSAVERHLLYARFELSVAELQATAVNLPLPADASGRASPAEVPGGGPAGRQWHQVLQPLRLGGMLRMHRVAEDYSLPQMQLSYIDLRFAADPPVTAEGGSTSARTSSSAAAAAAALATLEARLACSGASLSVQSMLDGLAVQASVSRLVLHDLSPAALQPHHLPPAVRGQPLPRVARQLAVDRLSLSHSVAAAAAPRSTTHVELHDLLVDGFAGEAGSFLARLHERQATHVSVTVSDSPTAMRTAVAASNLLIGHGLLLRVAALAEALTEQAAAAAEDGSGGLAAAGSSGVQLDADLAAHAEQAHSPPALHAVAQRAEAAQQEGAAAATAATAAEATPAVAAAGTAAAPAAAPEKQLFTSVQLSDCRLVLRYQPAMHPSAAGGGGSGHGGAGLAGLGGGAGIPAATHDFLSVHPDLMAVDVPLLRLHLPLHPAGLAAHAEAEDDAVAAGGGSESGDEGMEAALSSRGSSPAGGSPAGGSSPRGASSSRSGSMWREPSLMLGASEEAPAAARPEQVLVEASRLTVTVAAVGFARHSMLPLLQLPSLRLACSRAPASSFAGGSTRRRLLSSGGSSRLRAAPAGGSQPAAGVAYRLELASLDLGLHPSQLSMLTSAAQLCQYELAVLAREPADASQGGDAESMSVSLTITSAGALEQQLQQQAAAAAVAAHQRRQQRQQQLGSAQQQAASAGERPGTSLAAATPGPRTARDGSAGGTPQQVAGGPPAASPPQWRLDAAIGCIGVSLLGATPSSSCLKLEWQDLRASASAGGLLPGAAGAAGAAGGALNPAGSTGSSPVHPGLGGGSPAGSQSSARAQPEGELSLRLSWRQLALHAMHPRLPYTHPGLTPFAFAAGLASDLRQESQRNGHSGGSPPGGVSPRAAGPALPGPLFMRSRSGPGSAASAGVRRNLSVGLGLADAGREDSFHDATSAWLPRTSGSSGASRYFSMAESEFEDAASELLEGAQSPTGLGSAQPAPLPLQLGSREHDSQLLLLLHAASPPRGAAAAAAAARADAQSTAGSPGSAAGGLAAERFDGEDGGQQRDEGRTVIAAQLQLQAAQHAVVTINTLALRAHAAGWEEAAQCLHTYAVLAEQAQRQYATASEARAASPWGHQQGGGGGVQPAAARASDTAAPPGALALRLHLRSLLLEAVADGEGSFGGPGLVPALTLQAQVQLEADRGADGASRLQLAVPGLLLAVGTVASAGAAPGDGGGCNAGPPATLALPLQDSLLGLRGLELSLVSQQQRRHSQPAATTADGSVQLGDAHQVSVGATLAQASVWAYPRNLCAAAALAGHAQVLAAGVAAQLPLGELDGGMGDKAQPPGAPGAAAAPPRQFTAKVNVGKAAVLLSLLSREDAGSLAPARQQRLLAEPAPLLELAAAAVTADVRDMGAGSVEGSVKAELQVAVFSAIKMGWEPLVEPWQCRLAFAAPTTAPPAVRQRLAVSATQGLELTVTQAALEAAALAGGALQAAADVAADPSLLEARLEAAGSNAAYSAAYWLRNQTGSTLELWLAGANDTAPGDGSTSAGIGDSGSSGSSGSSPSRGTPFASAGTSAAGSARGTPRLVAGPPELVVRPGARVVLPVVAPSSTAQQGLHVGLPCPLHGVAGQAAHPPHDLRQSSGRLGLAPAGVATPSAHSSAGGLHGHEAPPPRTRPLLYFRLAEQADVSGPLHLDRGAFQGCSPCPGVLCDMSEARHGGYTLALHSGVQLRNTTQLALDIGVQTPIGLVMEPQTLGTLRPGGTMWLPALRAHTGLLCLRPSSGSTPSLAPSPRMPAPVATAQPAAPLQTAATWQPGGSSRIPSLAADSLAAAAALVAGTHGAAGAPPPRAPPTSPLLYSTAALASPNRATSEFLDLAPRGTASNGASASASAAAAAAAAWHPYEWSLAVPLQDLLRQVGGGEGGSGGRSAGPAFERNRGARTLVCSATAEGRQSVRLCMGAVRRGGPSAPGGGTAGAGTPAAAGGGADTPGAGSSWEVLLSAPLTLHNALPVPADVSLVAWGKPHRVLLQPNQEAALHGVDAAQVEHLLLRALGYHPTRPITPASLPASAEPGARQLTAPDKDVYLQEVGHSQSGVQVFLRHSLDLATGSHKLLFGCALWVFNCTGVPVALRQSGEGGMRGEGGEPGYHTLLDDEEVPESWLPPLELPGQAAGGGLMPSGSSQSPMASAKQALPAGLRAVSREGMHSVLSTPTTAAPSVATVSRGTSNVDIAGLSEILEGASTVKFQDNRQVLGLKRTVSRARGIADSMEATPAFETPSRWPSIQGGLQPHRQRLRLEIRATQCQAPPGRTYWSDPVELDALGGAAVVTVPSPLLPPTAAIPAARAAYQMSVTASQVPGSGGGLALYLLPRYLLTNTLDVPIQYKQQGTQHERELAAGASRALRWADMLRPPRLCVRVQEAGWMWSGGFELDSPGDLFIKIRHRDRGVTMLVRVDVATSAASGVLQVTLSHHPAGFAPYRIDNCSLETLHARQYRVREQQDVLRPYCSLHYAWDEPAQPHRLVLELPGARTLGTFDLDKVGQDVLLTLPTKRGEPQRRVRVLVRSEGPTRVLTVLDVQRHSLLEEMASAALPPPAEAAPAAAGRQQRPWDNWGLPTLQGSQQQAKRKSKLSGLLWEVSADLAWLGVSLVGATSEAAYLRAGGLKAEVAGTAAHLILDVELRHLQLDNPSPWVALPVTLMVPAPVSRLTSTVAAAVDVARKPALVARLALWQRRPAGVLCVEQADLQLAPVAVYVEQQHALALAEFLAHLASSFEAAAAAAATAGGGAQHAGAAVAAGGAAAPASGTGDGEGSSRAGSEAAWTAATGSIMSPTAAAAAAAAAAAPARRLPELPPELEALLSGRSAGPAAAEQKVYIDVLRIATLELTISFMPAPFQPDPGHPRLLALQRMLSLADIEDARLKLAALELHNPLMGTSALAQLLQRHYTRALLPELYKVVGSASVFGDPVRLFHHLGLGVWAFLASPAAGLVESARQRGPRQFLWGVASGTRGLFQNVVFALSNAATKGSTAARKAITAMGLDRLPYPQDVRWAGAGSTFRRRLQRWETEVVGGSGAAAAAAPGGGGGGGVMFSPRDGAEGLQHGGDGGVLGAVLRGVAGLAAEPIRGLDEGGFLGLLGGIKRGAIGVVVLPLVSLLEMSASTADSIRRAVAGSSNVGWVRPPRFVSPAQPLAPYSWPEAMGRWLLTELERSSLPRGHTPVRMQQAPAADSPLPASGLAAALQRRQQEEAPRWGAFVLCLPLAERGCFVVVSTKRLFYICARDPMWAPLVRWSARVADLELVALRGAHVSLVAQQPLRRRVVRSSTALPRALADVLKAPRPPFTFLTVECQAAADAAQLRQAVLRFIRYFRHHIRVLNSQMTTGQDPVERTGALAPADPVERLAVARREFGEHGGVNASTETSTTFTVLEADTLPQIFAGEKNPNSGGCYLYGRSFNPTVRQLSRQLAALEGGEAAYCTASGMAAISSTLLALCSAGDHIVCSNAVYGGTHALLKDFLPAKCGIRTTFVPVADVAAVAAAITPSTKLIYTESLSNPTLVLADIPALSQLARSKGLKLVVDNTFTPCILSPLRLGADIVVHSLTKFISGASDIIAGAVCAADGNFINSLMDLHMGPLMLLGPTMDPKVASELSLRMPTLALRMQEHSARAQCFAERLAALGARVCYPGLRSHPQHALLQRLANPGYGAGGMLTVELGSLDRAKCLMERLQNKHGFGLMAVSLGYFDTLMSASAASTSSELSDSELAAAGISGGLVRFSVGLTGSAEQRWGQLEEAWRNVAQVPASVKPAFRAHKVTRDAATGELKRTPSWQSFGSLVEGESSDGEDVTAGAFAAASGASRPAKKVRRLDDSSEVVYRRIHHRSASPATAAAHRLPPASAQASAALEAGIAATAAAGDTFGN